VADYSAKPATIFSHRERGGAESPGSALPSRTLYTNRQDARTERKQITMSERTYTIIDNQVVETATGEILCEAISHDGITSMTALEAALERIGRTEHALAAMQQHHAYILDNCKRQEKRLQSHVDYLRDLYGSHIEAFAHGRLTGQKSKTLETPFGKVKFRTVRGGVKVADKGLALAVAQKFGWVEAIKITEEFQISKISDAQKLVLIEQQPEGFEVTSDVEKCDIVVVDK
jgi:phage host-nuclease inhibitor protein Gam